ncbi:MAG: 2-oxo acid dehydrogenase subunit E2 [Thermoleophilia bacterium]|nr:2-oxo acid dehydrogenase subunit E2 [Thermoleophilia bacterium]
MSQMTMPKLSDTMEEGTVLRWLKADGDAVAKGEPLVEIETDKATMTVEAPESGTLRIIAAEGDTLDVGAPIADIGDGVAADSGATGVIEMPDAPTQEIEAVREEQAAAVEADDATGIPTADDGTADSIAAAFTPTQVPAAGQPVAASPLARSMAARAGLDLATVRGTGPGGRIVKADVEAALAASGLGAGAPAARLDAPGGAGVPEGASANAGAGPAGAAAPRPARPDVRPTVPTWPAGQRTPLTRLQRTIVRRMDEAVSIPVFTLERDVDATALGAARADLRVALPEDQRPSVNDFVIRAVAMAARERPDMVSRIEGDDLVVPAGVDVGVAVSVPGGLIVPVVHGADVKGVPAIAAEVRDLAARGREGTLRPDEMEGSVISVTNLGMFGVDRFHAVVNPGEAAILAVGRAAPRPVAVDGQVVVHDVMTLCLSVDHRVAYGAEAATFLGRVAELLEHPAALLV